MMVVVVVDTSCSRVLVKRVQRSGLWKKVFAAVCCMLGGGVSSFDEMEVTGLDVMARILLCKREFNVVVRCIEGGRA